MSARGMGENRLGGGEHGGTVGLNAVEGSSSGQTLELTPVEQPGVDARGEILEAAERTAAFALGDQLLHRLAADALERAQRIANGSIVHCEMRVACVDVGRQALDSAAPHVLDKHRQLVSQR